MKRFLTLFFAANLIVVCENLSFSQCSPEALAKYNEVEDLIKLSKEKSNEREFILQKEFALKAVKLTRKIQDKYDCFWDEPYRALTEAYLNLNLWDDALEQAKEAYNFCDKFKDRMRGELCDCKTIPLIQQGKAESGKGKDSTAVETFKEALRICRSEQGEKLNEALILQVLGSKEIELGKDSLGLNKITEAEKIIESQGLIKADFSDYILGKCATSRALVYFKRNDCNAQQMFLSGLEKSKKAFDFKTMAVCHFYIGKLCENESNFESALNYYVKASEDASAVGDTATLINIFNALGNIYNLQGKDSLAHEKIKNSYSMAKYFRYKKGMVDALIIDSKYEKNVLTQESAFAAMRIAMEINYFEGMTEAYLALENLYRNKKNDFFEAENYAKKALRIADSIGFIKGIVDANNRLGLICFRNKAHLDSTIHYFQIAEAKSKTGNLNTCGVYTEGWVDAYLNMAETYKTRKNHKKAQELYVAAKYKAEEISYSEGFNRAEHELNYYSEKSH